MGEFCAWRSREGENLHVQVSCSKGCAERDRGNRGESHFKKLICSTCGRVTCDVSVARQSRRAKKKK